MPLCSASAGISGLKASMRTSSGTSGSDELDLPKRIGGGEGAVAEARQAVVGGGAARGALVVRRQRALQRPRDGRASGGLGVEREKAIGRRKALGWSVDDSPNRADCRDRQARRCRCRYHRAAGRSAPGDPDHSVVRTGQRRSWSEDIGCSCSTTTKISE